MSILIAGPNIISFAVWKSGAGRSFHY